MYHTMVAFSCPSSLSLSLMALALAMDSPMLIDSQLFFTALALTLSLLILVLFSSSNNKEKKASSKRLNLPPGPKGWPLIGSLFQVARSGKPFIHYSRDLRDIYGPIFTLRMGARTLIVVTSAELIHEALIEKGQAFASRPAENPTRNIFSCNKLTVNSAVYGPEWRSLRRNMVSGMLSAARLRDHRPARLSAMDGLLRRIRLEAGSGNGAVAVLKNARFAFFCILLSMCFGVDLDEDAVANIDRVMKKVLITLNPRMDDYLPLLAPFFSRQRREALEVRRLQIETLVPLIEKRRAILRSPDDPPNSSYLDSLLDLKVEGRESAPTVEELVTLCSEFINGGTDTTATAIEWAIARLIESPLIQSRMHDEIAAEVGKDRAVEEGDTERMPYLQAFVKELLRKHPPTYFSLTHAAARAGERLGGYDIPVGANLEIHLQTVSEDPRLWLEPERFEPERFLEAAVDMTGVTGVRMIPFGAGRRICPGLGMATTHITMMVARMVQAFEWSAHPSQPVMEFDEKVEFTVVMRRPLVAAVRPRK